MFKVVREQTDFPCYSTTGTYTSSSMLVAYDPSLVVTCAKNPWRSYPASGQSAKGARKKKAFYKVQRILKGFIPSLGMKNELEKA